MSNATVTLNEEQPQVRHHLAGRPSNNPQGRTPATRTHATFLDLRNKLICSMKEIHSVSDYDPVIAMAEIACDVANPVSLRLKAHAEIAPYVYPTLKQVEISGPGGGPIEHKLPVVDSLLTAMLAGGTLPMELLGKTIEATAVVEETEQP